MLRTGNLGLDLSQKKKSKQKLQQNKTKQKQTNKQKIKNQGAYMNLPYNLKKISDKDYRLTNCIIINNSTKIFIFHFIHHVYLGGSFWNQFKACTRRLKKSNKQTKIQKRKRKTKQNKNRKKNKQKQKQKTKKGPLH